MMRLLTVAVLLVCAATTPTLADGIEVLFDFEDQELGGLDLYNGLELSDATTGLRVTFDRVSNFPGAPALPLEIVDLGDPGIGYGRRSLSPFLDTRASPFAGYLRISIDTSGLIGEAFGKQVKRVDWDMGDWFPSDDDDLWIGYDSAFGTPDPFQGYVPSDNADYPIPSFGSQTYTLISSFELFQVRMFGGTEDSPNSVFYDNFIFSLVDAEIYGPEDETPISNFTGEGEPGSLGPQEGQNGGTRTVPPIPEPGTLFGVGAGLLLLGLRARRRAR